MSCFVTRSLFVHFRSLFFSLHPDPEVWVPTTRLLRYYIWRRGGKEPRQFFASIVTFVASLLFRQFFSSFSATVRGSSFLFFDIFGQFFASSLATQGTASLAVLLDTTSSFLHHFFIASSSRVCNGRRRLQFVQLLPTGGKEDHSARSTSEFRWSPATAGPIRRGVRGGTSRGSSRLPIRCELDEHLRDKFVFGLFRAPFMIYLLQEDVNITFSDAVKKASDLERLWSRPLLVPDWLAPQSIFSSDPLEVDNSASQPQLSDPTLASHFSEPLQSGPHLSFMIPNLSSPSQVRRPSHWLLLLTRSHNYCWSVVIPASRLNRPGRHRSSKSAAGPRTRTYPISN